MLRNQLSEVKQTTQRISSVTIATLLLPRVLASFFEETARPPPLWKFGAIRKHKRPSVFGSPAEALPAIQKFIEKNRKKIPAKINPGVLIWFLASVSIKDKYGVLKVLNSHSKNLPDTGSLEIEQLHYLQPTYQMLSAAEALGIGINLDVEFPDLRFLEKEEEFSKVIQLFDALYEKCDEKTPENKIHFVKAFESFNIYCANQGIFALQLFRYPKIISIPGRIKQFLDLHGSEVRGKPHAGHLVDILSTYSLAGGDANAVLSAAKSTARHYPPSGNLPNDYRYVEITLDLMRAFCKLQLDSTCITDLKFPDIRFLNDPKEFSRARVLVDKMVEICLEKDFYPEEVVDAVNGFDLYCSEQHIVNISAISRNIEVILTLLKDHGSGIGRMPHAVDLIVSSISAAPKGNSISSILKDMPGTIEDREFDLNCVMSTLALLMAMESVNLTYDPDQFPDLRNISDSGEYAKAISLIEALRKKSESGSIPVQQATKWFHEYSLTGYIPGVVTNSSVPCSILRVDWIIESQKSIMEFLRMNGSRIKGNPCPIFLMNLLSMVSLKSSAIECVLEEIEKLPQAPHKKNSGIDLAEIEITFQLVRAIKELKIDYNWSEFPILKYLDKPEESSKLKKLFMDIGSALTEKSFDVVSEALRNLFQFCCQRSLVDIETIANAYDEIENFLKVGNKQNVPGNVNTIALLGFLATAYPGYNKLISLGIEKLPRSSQTNLDFNPEIVKCTHRLLSALNDLHLEFDAHAFPDFSDANTDIVLARGNALIKKLIDSCVKTNNYPKTVYRAIKAYNELTRDFSKIRSDIMFPKSFRSFLYGNGKEMTSEVDSGEDLAIMANNDPAKRETQKMLEEFRKRLSLQDPTSDRGHLYQTLDYLVAMDELNLEVEPADIPDARESAREQILVGKRISSPSGFADARQFISDNYGKIRKSTGIHIFHAITGFSGISYSYANGILLAINRHARAISCLQDPEINHLSSTLRLFESAEAAGIPILLEEIPDLRLPNRKEIRKANDILTKIFKNLDKAGEALPDHLVQAAAAVNIWSLSQRGPAINISGWRDDFPKQKSNETIGNFKQRNEVSHETVEDFKRRNDIPLEIARDNALIKDFLLTYGLINNDSSILKAMKLRVGQSVYQSADNSEDTSIQDDSTTTTSFNSTTISSSHAG